MYLKGTLSSDEEILVNIRFSWFKYFWLICLTLIIFLTSILLSFWPIVFLLAVVIYPFLEIYTVEMVCTNKRIIYKKGIVSVETKEILVKKVESVSIEQTFWGRIFGFGDLHFRGTGESDINFTFIANAQNVKAEIEGIVAKEQTKISSNQNAFVNEFMSAVVNKLKDETPDKSTENSKDTSSIEKNSTDNASEKNQDASAEKQAE